jgi:hypothetical protein
VIGFAIRSALAQTEPDFELIVVGDGCSDSTAEVVRAFDDPRVKWLDLPKAPGIGYAHRNRALTEASGRFIAYLAHDDVWFPDHLARLGARLDEPGVELVYSRLLAVGLDGALNPSWYNLGVPRHAAGLWRGDSAITMCAVAHTRDCVAKYGPWDDSLRQGADIVMWHRILAGGAFGNAAFVSDPTSFHFVARWRHTEGYARRMRAGRRLLHGLATEVRPPSLHLPIDDGELPQAAAWRLLSSDAPVRVARIRAGVTEMQDALFWKVRTIPGLVGLRAGLLIGAVLEGAWRSIVWLRSKDFREKYRSIRAATRADTRTRR